MTTTDQQAHSQTPRFRGIIPPMVTLLTDRDQLDIPGLERLLEHLVAGGVAGVFILGTTGEAPGLSYRLRRELIRRTATIINKRLPLLVGITDTAFVESVALAEVAAEAGAEAVVLATPYYFPAGQTELLGYIENITRALPLPLMLYNMPSLTKVWFEIPTLEKLADIPAIIGVKDSSGDLDYFTRLVQLRQRRPDWSIMMGPEHLLVEAVARGAQGGVCGGANVIPQLFVACYQAATAHDDARAEKLLKRVHMFGNLYSIGKYASRYIKATKCALSLLGICDDFMAEPFHRFRPEHRRLVREMLAANFSDLVDLAE